MLAFVKFVHFFAIAVGMGGGMANFLIGHRSAGAAVQAMPILGGLQKTFGQLSTVAIVVLWLTGGWLVYSLYDWQSLTLAFWLKIAFVLLLSVAAIVLQVNAIRAERAGTPPPADVMAKWGATADIAAILALLVAVFAFG